MCDWKDGKIIMTSQIRRNLYDAEGFYLLDNKMNMNEMKNLNFSLKKRNNDDKIDYHISHKKGKKLGIKGKKYTI